MILVTILPFLIGMSSLIYLVSAILLGAGFLYWSLVLYSGQNRKAPMATFRYSITYLMLLFVALLVDHYALPMNAVPINTIPVENISITAASVTSLSVTPLSFTPLSVNTILVNGLPINVVPTHQIGLG